MAPSLLTFSDLEMSNSGSYIFSMAMTLIGQIMAISHKILQIGIYLLLFTNRKSNMGFLMAPSTLTLRDLEMSNLRSCIFLVAISKNTADEQIFTIIH